MPSCAAALAEFEQLRCYWHSLAAELGISLSVTKRQEPGQRVEYTGVIVDTIAGRLFIPDKKLEKLRTCLTDLVAAAESTTREHLSVRGRVRHYSRCVDYLLPLVPTLSTEAEDSDRLDSRLPLSGDLRASAELVLHHVTRFAVAGSAIWRPVASSLYGAFLRGDVAGLFVVVVTWDSSRAGMGCVVRTSDDPGGRLVVSTFGPEDSYHDQVHLEAAGGCMALAAASRIYNLRGATVILRNDATGALSAFRRGSFHSSVLQALAVRMTTLCADLQICPFFLHAPGKELVDEGLDDASRRLASAVAGPACSAALRSLVHEIAAAQGWSISVDLFASACNCLVDRYFSEYSEPKAEAVDALAVTDWNCSSCPHCHAVHRESIFAFPPRALLRRFIAKARADGARGVIIVPFAISAFYWPRLLAAARPIADKLVIRNPGSMLADSSGFLPPALAVFAIDFGLDSAHCSDLYAPACGQEGAWRGRPLLGHPSDVADRRQIHIELERAVRLANVGTAPPSLLAL